MWKVAAKVCTVPQWHILTLYTKNVDPVIIVHLLENISKASRQDKHVHKA
jgi:hypothetical protein